eukprot:3935560-Rhodomonas_salina.1
MARFAETLVSALLLSLCLSSSRTKAAIADLHASDQTDVFQPAPRNAHPGLDEVEKDFWHVPVSASEECNIETIECRARGVHWEASPPVFVIVSRAGDERRARDMLSTCTLAGGRENGGGREELESGRAGQRRRFFVLTSASEEEARSMAPEKIAAEVTFVGVDEDSLTSPS